MIFILFLFIIG